MKKRTKQQQRTSRFTRLLTQLYRQTGGRGPVWADACAVIQTMLAAHEARRAAAQRG